jgi:hypothetical protein
MTVSMVVLMAVVFAPGRRLGQLAGQVGLHQGFDGCRRPTGTHRDAVVGEDLERPPADAPHNDGRDTLLAQPPGERAGLMLGRRDDLRPQDLSRVRIDSNQRELAAATEMAVQAPVFMGNGNSHGRHCQGGDEEAFAACAGCP